MLTCAFTYASVFACMLHLCTHMYITGTHTRILNTHTHTQMQLEKDEQMLVGLLLRRRLCRQLHQCKRGDRKRTLVQCLACWKHMAGVYFQRPEDIPMSSFPS